MVDLNALAIYARVAEALSFSDAARRLGVPVSTVSRKVADLEDALGVQLIERTTRKLRLTDIGREVLLEAQRGAEVREAVEAIVADCRAKVSGRIALTAPPSVADSLLAPLLSGFQTAYPDVAVQVLVTDRFVDHIAEGIDVALRVGDLKDSALVAKPLLTYRRRLVANPKYLKQFGALRRPADLRDHRLLAFAVSGFASRWTLSKGEKSETIEFRPVLAMNDYAGLAEAAAGGAGISDLPPIVRPQLLKSGRLVEVLQDWRLKAETLSIVRVGARHVPNALRAFMDFAAAGAKKMFPELPA